MPYDAYGLRDNPFPRGGAILKPDSTDKRENGSIFSKNARDKEIKEFEKKFLGSSTTFDDRLRCGFIWAEGDRLSGRGMGKTALVTYLKHQINDGYGRQFHSGSKRFFASYVSFQKEVRSRIEFLFKEAFISFAKEGLFRYIAKNAKIEDMLSAGIEKDFAEAIANDKVKEYLESLSRYKLGEMLTAYDQRFLVKLDDLFLNQTTKALRLAGFEGGILMVDDLENLTDVSTGKEIETFIKNFGLAFFRPGSVASDDNFYTIVLTTHQQSATKISQAWTVAGLSASFPLVAGGHSSVLTRKPDMEQCLDIVSEHLKEYRLAGSSPSSDYFPFEKEAVEKVIRECNYHPRRFLSRLRRIIVYGLENGESVITSRVVDLVPESEEEAEGTAGAEDLR